MLGLGLYRFAAPRQAYQLFGLPLAASSSPSPFIYVSAGRDIAIGITYALLGLQGNRQGLKAFIIGTAVRRLS